MSNTRKIDLAKLARIMARDLTSPRTAMPSVVVSPKVAARLEACGWERGREFEVIEPDQEVPE